MLALRLFLPCILIAGCSQPTQPTSPPRVQLIGVAAKDEYPLQFVVAIHNPHSEPLTAASVTLTPSYLNLLTETGEGVPPEFEDHTRIVEGVVNPGKGAVQFEFHWDYPAAAPDGLAFVSTAFTVHFDNGETVTTKENAIIMESSAGIFDRTIDRGTVPEPVRLHVLKAIESMKGKPSERVKRLRSWAQLDGVS